MKIVRLKGIFVLEKFENQQNFSNVLSKELKKEFFKYMNVIQSPTYKIPDFVSFGNNII